MNMAMGNIVYWHKDQVVLRFKSQPTYDVLNTIEVNFEKLNAILFEVIHLRLKLPFDTIMVYDPRYPDNSDAFHFAHIDPNPQTGMKSMSGNEEAPGMGVNDNTIAVIELLNAHKHTFAHEGLPDFDIIPHWLWSGTGDIIHGCPVSPPIPVEEFSASGRCKITLPQLPDSLQRVTGKGVTVFVLDTLPPPEMIELAAKAAGKNNLLLQEMATGMIKAAPYNALPPAISVNYSFNKEIPGPEQSATTGKDIYGRLVGFPMADHGLAIAGIVRDLAPDANIECIRVLNDFGVGDVRSLAHALIDIYNRMSPKNSDTGQEGVLHNKPVVINLSLVVLPPGIDAPEEVKGEIMSSSLDVLHKLMKYLADQGAIFVASVGNDSDPRDTKMNPLEVRFGPRYPAAFAEDTPDRPSIRTMIPVGAVNQMRKAASYSNYPGLNGIATYGGGLPKPNPWLPSAISHVNARVDTTEPIDALCGVYSAQFYPALSVNDHYATSSDTTPTGMSSEYPEYDAPNSCAWAYWSGTSFATPIIAALAARILQGQAPKSIDVRQAIISAARGQGTMWTGVSEVEGRKDESGPMIMAVQDWMPDDNSM